MDAGLPSVHRLSVDAEGHRLAVGPLVVGPVIVGVDFGIEEESGQQKLRYGARHASVVVTLKVAVLVGKIEQT